MPPTDPSSLLLVTALATMSLFGAFGLHRFVTLARWMRVRRRVDPLPQLERWPRVTVQVPMYNERFVAARVLEAVLALDYPPELLEIQVLDDSTDDTGEIVAETLRRIAPACPVRHLRRAKREGYKAGALAAGLAVATGELIAIFDADFAPSPDFLRRTVPRFGCPALGMVQCRWGFLNANENLLTRAQELLLSSHFAIEQVVRSRLGHFFNFNGTAGIWRRGAIEDAGGWSSDTLTEDLDLSYRARLRGWRFFYDFDTVVVSELPADIRAFKTQQHRWSKGMTQVARKLTRALLRSDAALSVKLEGLVHLHANVGYVLVLLMSVALVPALFVHGDRLRAHPMWPWASACWFITNVVAIAAFAVAADVSVHGRVRRRLGSSLPALFAIGIGLGVVGSAGFLSGLRGSPTEFRRTPKEARVARRWGRTSGYAEPPNAGAWLEAGLLALQVVWFHEVLSQGRLDLLPLSALLTAGFLSFVFFELRFERARRANAPGTSAGAAPTSPFPRRHPHRFRTLPGEDIA
jgi:cellulose synthase/poly-beta-1,6-N-acetylglucosamine synthase-like glycosyltransferase